MHENLRVVLVAPRNPLNIGAAARAISNFGFRHLRLVDAYEVAFQEARSAVKAGPILQAAQQYPTVADAVADCTLVVGTSAIGPRDLEHTVHRLESGGRLMREQLASAPVALLFGSEKFGLSNEDLAHCHWLIRIPTRPEHGSMNMGQSVAVCLYELIRDEAKGVAGPMLKQPAAAGQIEMFSALLMEVLRAVEYLNPVTSESHEQKLRRLIRRMELTTGDTNIWLGICRQILWKLRGGQ